MVGKALRQILEIDPEAKLASRDPLVRSWNIEILDKIVQDAARQLPKQPTGEEMRALERLKTRVEALSEQLEELSPEYGRFHTHVQMLIDKIALFEKQKVVTVQTLLRHPMTEKILGFRKRSEESLSWLCLKLLF